MKIALFGASGKTGQQFLEQALEKGYKINALVRNPAKLIQKTEHLNSIKGDVLSADDVVNTVTGCDLVVSLFGHVKDSPEWLQTDGTKNILKAMKINDVHKIISLSGGGLPFREKDQPKFIDKTIRFIMKLIVPKILNDAVKHAEILKNSGTNWIIVRGPRLTDGGKTGEYKIGWVGVNSGTSISRADLADFILKQVDKDQFNQQMPFVSY
jgi:putative NADH-flavin reductase